MNRNLWPWIDRTNALYISTWRKAKLFYSDFQGTLWVEIVVSLHMIFTNKL